MDLITQRLTSEADIIQTNAMNARLPEGKYGNASHRDWIARNDPDGTELKAYDEMMARIKLPEIQLYDAEIKIHLYRYYWEIHRKDSV